MGEVEDWVDIMEVCREIKMSELVSISTKQAVKYLNYKGPVFLYTKQARIIDTNHKDYPALKKMVAAYYNGGQ